MSGERLALLLTAVLFCCRGSSAQDKRCVVEATLTIAPELNRHYIFRGEWMYEVQVDRPSESFKLVQTMPLREGPFQSFTGPKVTRAWSWRKNDDVYHAIIGDHQHSSYIRVNKDGSLNYNGSFAGDSLTGALSFSSVENSKAFSMFIYTPGYFYYHEFGRGTIIQVVDISNGGRPTFRNRPETDNNRKNMNGIAWELFRSRSQVNPIGVFLLVNPSLEDSTWLQPVVAFTEKDGITHHCFGEARFRSCDYPGNYKKTDPRLIGCSEKKKDEKPKKPTGRCILDAAMTISPELGLHFLIHGDRMYKIKVDVAGKTLSLDESFPISEKYFTNWQGKKVTRTFAWRSSEFPDLYLAVIGDHKFTSYARIKKNGEVDFSGGLWMGDSMDFLVNDPNPKSRAFFYSQYEPGYLFLEEYEGNDLGKWYYIVDLQAEKHRVYFHRTTEWNSVHQDNPQMEVNKLFDKEKFDNSLKPIGVFLIGSSDFYGQQVVVFAEHENRTKYCFGDVAMLSCVESENYVDIEPRLFGCGVEEEPEIKTDAPKVAETDAPKVASPDEPKDDDSPTEPTDSDSAAISTTKPKTTTMKMLGLDYSTLIFLVAVAAFIFLISCLIFFYVSSISHDKEQKEEPGLFEPLLQKENGKRNGKMENKSFKAASVPDPMQKYF